ncbi:hypothetical protein SELMODRAFT_407891 [Selaginella moellendorffii]|uniref:Homeobox domain-containing protein n=1 Tax=Selaginella moellendorffii TaxID=88036 RepID=D8R539_SELML|nr:hypothetical protein SELMODRAFT_407891 [Selaginella moellendorffii]
MGMSFLADQVHPLNYACMLMVTVWLSCSRIDRFAMLDQEAEITKFQWRWWQWKLRKYADSNILSAYSTPVPTRNFPKNARGATAIAVGMHGHCQHPNGGTLPITGQFEDDDLQEFLMKLDEDKSASEKGTRGNLPKEHDLQEFVMELDEDNSAGEEIPCQESPATTLKRRRELSGTRGNLPKQAVEVMLSWLYANRQNPYPSKEQKQKFAQDLGITKKQVENFFSNSRARVLKRNK